MNGNGWIVEVKSSSLPNPENERDRMQAVMEAYLWKENQGLETPGLEKIEKEIAGDIYHYYELDGQKIPGLTTVLKYFDNWPVSKHYLERGSWVHHICQKIDEGKVQQDWIDHLPKSTLNRPNVNMEDGFLWQAWFNGYIKFKKDYGLENVRIHNEVPLASHKFRFAATIDKIIMNDEPLKAILLYLTPKGYKAIEIPYSEKIGSEFRDLYSYFQNILRLYHDRKGKPLPMEEYYKHLAKLRAIVEGKSVKRRLLEYIEEMEVKS